MALSFQVRIGIPGCLTIEIDALPILVPQNPTNLYAPLNQPILTDPASIVSKVWGQGWATPMTQRLIALGGNTNRQLLSFECPSIDTTDMAWGGNASIDATTDPAQINVTPFGASNFGRAFAPGNYIIWDDPTLINGRYQYEIDQIKSIAPFVLQRRGPGAPLGSAQFGSYKGAHTNCNFLQLLDPSFQVLWDGTRQVYKFLWDNMIVAAGQCDGGGLMAASIVNLAAVPPDPPIGGLATGGTSAAGLTANTPGVALGPDGVPVSSVPLPPTTPVVSALPAAGDPLAVVDQYVIFGGKVYIYTAFPGGANYWALDTTGIPSIRDIWGNLHLYPAANYPVGTVFQAIDWLVSYSVQSVAGTNEWIYYNGIYEAPLASVPTALLGARDYRLIFRASDYFHNWKWAGAAFSLTAAALDGFAGGLAPGSLVFANPGPPFGGSGALWNLCDGSTQDVSQEDATVVATVLPTIANTWFVR